MEHYRRVSRKLEQSLQTKVQFHDWFPVSQPFQQFPEIIDWIYKQESTERQKAQLCIAAKLFNHVQSSIFLAIEGLYVDSMLCTRNALEALEVFILLSIDNGWLDKYWQNKIPNPGDIHRALMELHQPQTIINFDKIRSIHQNLSSVTHMNTKANNFILELDEEQKKMFIYMGGLQNEKNRDLSVKLALAVLDAFNYFGYRSLLKSDEGKSPHRVATLLDSPTRGD